MCGRFIIFSEAQEKEIMDIVEEVNRKYGDDAMKSDAEIFPTDTTPVIMSNNGSKEINLLKWGFLNYKGGPVIINARSETLMERPMFREPFRNRRCLIPATAFYEWKKVEGKKEKYIIHSSEASLFYMAGLYKDFIDKCGNPFTGFVIITTAASGKMSEIHDRMPVMLTREDAIDLWVNNEVSDISTLNNILLPNDNILIEAS
jgi:Uncharacterized conserved protein